MRYSADSAFSNTSYLRVSLENPPSSCCNGTVSEIEDKIENGIIDCPEEELMVEEESMLIIVPEDFEMAMMKAVTYHLMRRCNQET